MIEHHPIDGNFFLKCACEMEQEILNLYHEFYPIAEQYGEESKDMSVALLIEENIEHTTNDLDEMKKLYVRN